MSNLGKKWNCFSCGAKFYDLGKPDPSCPKCGANQKNAPAKARAPKKEKAALQIDDDYAPDMDIETPAEDSLEESLGITPGRPDGVDPGDLNMDDYDE